MIGRSGLLYWRDTGSRPRLARIPRKHSVTTATALPRSLTSLLRPIRAMRIHYVPLLLVYFAYGALGIIDVTRDMWIKERLTLSPAELAGIGVWLSLP